MFKLVGGKMVWVPMDAAGQEGEAGGGAAAEAGEGESGGDEGSDGEAGLPPDLDDWMTPDARKAFEYDPFAPPEEGEAGEGEKAKSGEPGDGTEGGAAGGEAGSESAAGKAQKESEKAQEGKAGAEAETSEERVARLEKQLADYQQMMHEQLTSQAKKGEEKAGEKAGEKESDPLEAIPAYQPFKIPDAIKEKIFSEKPEDMMEGLGMMMQGVAQITHYNVRKEMAAMMDERINKTVDSKQSELTEKQKAEQTQDSIRKDWEETYPDLADKDLRPLVSHIGSQVVAETGAKEWNAKLRDEIAARVRKVLGRKEEAQNGKEEETPPPAGGKKPPYSARGSARKGAPKTPDPVQQEISDTLGLF